MPTRHAGKKWEILTRLQQFGLGRRTVGFSTREAADVLGVSERTARRYITELSGSDDGRLSVMNDRGKWTQVESADLPRFPVHLSLLEGLSGYLAVRLMSAHSTQYNPYTVNALNQLGWIMPDDIAAHIRRTADDVASRRSAAGFVDILTCLAEAWVGRRQVRITYRSTSVEEAPSRTVDPYFLEPTASSLGCYLIAYDHFREDIRIFKIERIRNAEMLATGFEIQDDFDPYQHLSTAWGIMGGHAPTEVRLRFSARVRRRVRESDWPGAIEAVDTADGGCELTVQVSDPLEMRPGSEAGARTAKCSGPRTCAVRSPWMSGRPPGSTGEDPSNG